MATRPPRNSIFFSRCVCVCVCRHLRQVVCFACVCSVHRVEWRKKHFKRRLTLFVGDALIDDAIRTLKLSPARSKVQQAFGGQLHREALLDKPVLDFSLKVCDCVVRLHLDRPHHGVFLEPEGLGFQKNTHPACCFLRPASTPTPIIGSLLCQHRVRHERVNDPPRRLPTVKFLRDSFIHPRQKVASDLPHHRVDPHPEALQVLRGLLEHHGPVLLQQPHARHFFAHRFFAGTAGALTSPAAFLCLPPFVRLRLELRHALRVGFLLLVEVCQVLGDGVELSLLLHLQQRLLQRLPHHHGQERLHVSVEVERLVVLVHVRGGVHARFAGSERRLLWRGLKVVGLRVCFSRGDSNFLFYQVSRQVKVGTPAQGSTIIVNRLLSPT
mmetsp:Transcript_54032/g.107248  ORF Transcript_54032/g.107248 Transcript_54032/m.107248 type:complete len:383 (+) Transcript_54032:158-1306(+)